LLENLFTAFLYLFLEVADFLVDLLPETSPTVSAQIVSFVTPFRNILATSNYLFPVEDLFIVMGIILTVESSMFLFKVVQWILQSLINRQISKIITMTQ